MGLETYGNVQPVTWDNYFLTHHEVLKRHGVVNIPRTSVVILSGTDVNVDVDCTIETVLSNEGLSNRQRWKNDIDRVNRLRSIPETNHMKFNVFDLGKYFHDFKNMTSDDHRNCNKRILEDVRNSYPTVIVLPFRAAKFLHANNSSDIADEIIRLDENSKEGAKLNGMDGIVAADILKLIRRKPSIWQEPLFVTESCLLLKTKNIIQSNYTLLSSATRITASGIEDSVPRLLDGIKFLGSAEYISILFISGTHGNLEGISGLNDLSMLERRFYEATCKMLGINAHVSKPAPEALPLDENADDEAILRHPLYRMIKFNALDIQRFHKNEKGLIDYVRAFDPNAIVLDWCFAKDGDVANVLCKSGILAELWLQHEKTSMVGITDGKWINLDIEQTKYLHEVAKRVDDNELRHFVIYGGHGTGKTVLGLQTANIVIGKLKEASPKGCVLFIIDADSVSTKKTPLLLSIEAMFKDEDCIKHFYTTTTLKEESGIEKELDRWELHNILWGIHLVCDKLYKDQKINKILLIDELSAQQLFYRNSRPHSLEDQFYDDTSYTITCVSPLSRSTHKYSINNSFESMVHSKHQKERLFKNQIMVRELKVTYRNSKEIQFLYNVYLAHYNPSPKNNDVKVFTGSLNQPDMDSSDSSNPEGIIRDLPVGSRPVLLVSKKASENWSDSDIKDIHGKVVGLLDGNKNSLFSLCINEKERDCGLCRKITWKYQNKYDSTPTMLDGNIGYHLYDTVRGCEKENVVIHYSGLSNLAGQFEFISRARKRLVLIIDSNDLDSGNPFFTEMKELRNHSQTCRNMTCQKNNWDKTEVFDVVEIGTVGKLEVSD